MRSFLKFILLMMATLPLTAWSASKVELDARVRAAIELMYTDVPASRELAQKAAGMLVFPTIIKGGIGIGGEYGEGALLVNGATVQYYRLTALSFGFQLGGQGKTEVLLFMTGAALQEFRDSEGWEAGVDGSIAVLEFGVGKEIDTNNIRDPIIGFVFNNKGLMYDLSLEGTKFWKIHKK